MDLVTLSSSDFTTTGLIEGYTSLIWTERYVDPGDFELKTTNVDSTADALPLGSLVSILQSAELMFVESHLIETDDQGNETLTIKGRSFETFLDCRVITAHDFTNIAGGDSPGQRYGRKLIMQQAYTPAEAACLIAWNYLVNTGTKDVIQAATPPYAKNPNDAVPNLKITNSNLWSQDSKQRFVASGSAYDAFVKVLRTGKNGVRGIRPTIGTTGNVMTFSNAGVPTSTSTANMTKLRLDIYSGYDRSIGGGYAYPTVFRYDAGHLRNPSYFKSNQAYRTMALVNSSYALAIGYPNGDPTGITNLAGLARRLTYVDGGVYQGDETDQASFFNSLEDMGDAELKTRRVRTLFAGDFSPNAPYVYGGSGNSDYYLGDFVTLQAEHHYQQTMLVSEYVRVEDQTGEIGYPTLDLPP